MGGGILLARCIIVGYSGRSRNDQLSVPLVPRQVLSGRQVSGAENALPEVQDPRAAS